ncbi:MAG: hypothetical protein AAF892_14310 [Cyanobacteria bacterium P01_D01_bin.71]
MLKRRAPINIALLLSSAATFGVLTQVDIAPWLKPALLLLPLQVVAIAYVIWVWRDRSATARSLSRQSNSQIHNSFNK